MKWKKELGRFKLSEVIVNSTTIYFIAQYLSPEMIETPGQQHCEVYAAAIGVENDCFVFISLRESALHIKKFFVLVYIYDTRMTTQATLQEISRLCSYLRYSCMTISTWCMFLALRVIQEQ